MRLDTKVPSTLPKSNASSAKNKYDIQGSRWEHFVSNKLQSFEKIKVGEKNTKMPTCVKV